MSYLPGPFVTPSTTPPSAVTEELRAVDELLAELFDVHDIPIVDQIAMMADDEDSSATANLGQDRSATATPATPSTTDATGARHDGRSSRSSTVVTCAAIVTASMLLLTAAMSSGTTTNVTSTPQLTSTLTTAGALPTMTPSVMPPTQHGGPAGDGPATPAIPTSADDGPSETGELIPPDAPGIVAIVPLLPDPVTLPSVPTRARGSRIPRRTPTSRAAARRGTAPQRTIANAPIEEVFQPQPRFDLDVERMVMPTVQFDEPPTRFPVAIHGARTRHTDYQISALDRELLVEAERPRNAPQFVTNALQVCSWQSNTDFLSAYNQTDYEPSDDERPVFELDPRLSRTFTYHAPPYVYAQNTYHRGCLHKGLRYDRHSHCIYCVAQAILAGTDGYCTALCEVCARTGDAFARYREFRIQTLIRNIQTDPVRTADSIRSLPARIRNQLYANQERILQIRNDLRVQHHQRPPTTSAEVTICAQLIRRARNQRPRSAATPQETPTLSPDEASTPGSPASRPSATSERSARLSSPPARRPSTKRRRISSASPPAVADRRRQPRGEAWLAANAEDIEERVHINIEGDVLSPQQLAEMINAPPLPSMRIPRVAAHDTEPSIRPPVISPTRRSPRTQRRPANGTKPTTACQEIPHQLPARRTPAVATVSRAPTEEQEMEESSSDDNFTAEYVAGETSSATPDMDTASTLAPHPEASSSAAAAGCGSTDAGEHLRYIPPHSRPRADGRPAVRAPVRRHHGWPGITAPQASVVARIPRLEQAPYAPTEADYLGWLPLELQRSMTAERQLAEAHRQEMQRDLTHRARREGLSIALQTAAAQTLDLVLPYRQRRATNDSFSESELDTPENMPRAFSGVAGAVPLGPVIALDRQPQVNDPVVVLPRMPNPTSLSVAPTLQDILLQCHQPPTSLARSQPTLQVTQTVITSATVSVAPSPSVTSTGTQTFLRGIHLPSRSRSTDMEEVERFDQSTQTTDDENEPASRASDGTQPMTAEPDKRQVIAGEAENLVTPVTGAVAPDEPATTDPDVEAGREAQLSDSEDAVDATSNNATTAGNLIPDNGLNVASDVRSASARGDDSAQAACSETTATSGPTGSEYVETLEGDDAEARSDAAESDGHDDIALTDDQLTVSPPRQYSDPSLREETNTATNQSRPDRPEQPVQEAEGDNKGNRQQDDTTTPATATAAAATNITDVLRAALQTTLQGLSGADIGAERQGGTVPLTITIQGPIHIHVHPRSTAPTRPASPTSAADERPAEPAVTPSGAASGSPADPCTPHSDDRTATM